MKNLTWTEKYNLALKEMLSIKEIMKLRSIGQPSAIQIRKKAIEYCLSHEISIPSNKVPTEIVFEVTGHNLGYYYEKMKLEIEAQNILDYGVKYVSP